MTSGPSTPAGQGSVGAGATGARLVLAEELRDADAEDLRSALARVDTGVDVLIDASIVSHLAPACLAVVASFAARLDADGRRLLLVNPTLDLCRAAAPEAPPLRSREQLPPAPAASSGPGPRHLAVELSVATREARLAGELDLTGADYLRGVLGTLRGGGVTVDLSGLRLLDASGISLLVETRRRLEADGWRLHLVGATGLVRRVFEIVGLEGMLRARRRGDGSDRRLPSSA